MEYIFLTQEFYTKYNETDYSEIERKPTRPYIMIKVTLNDLDFGIPLRSGIKHKYALWTDKKNKCGADYSKAVLINDEKYIDSKNPYIRPDEHSVLKGKEYLLKSGFEKYIEKYKKALSRIDIERNKKMCQYSTLQYFHEELNIDEEGVSKVE